VKELNNKTDDIIPSYQKKTITSKIGNSDALREPDVKMQKRKLDDLVDTHNDLKRKDMLNSTNL